MNSSLQKSLFVWLTAAIVTTGILAAAIAFLLANEDAKEFQDHMLRQVANLIARNPGMTTQVDMAGSRRPTREAVDLAAWFTVVRLPEDQRPPWLPEKLKPGFKTLETDGGRRRVFVLGDGSSSAIVVSQPTRIREEIAINSALMALISLLVILPVMIWLTLRIVRRQFAGVNKLAVALDAQSADQPVPIDDCPVPDEIAPFMQAINRLLARISDLLDQRKRFIADAAHELRTPLTALSIQAENLAHAGSMGIMFERVVPLKAGIERARQLTEQLLDLARIQARAPSMSMVEIAPLARELIAEFTPLSDVKHIDLGLEEVTPLQIRAAADSLRLVLRNALDNALKYTPAGGEVTLRISSDDSNDRIDIIDSGPGIPDSQRDRVCEPFYRIPGTRGEGTGLGLAIAREAAARMGGTVTLLDRPGTSGLIFRYQQPAR